MRKTFRHGHLPVKSTENIVPRWFVQPHAPVHCAVPTPSPVAPHGYLHVLPWLTTLSSCPPALCTPHTHRISHRFGDRGTSGNYHRYVPMGKRRIKDGECCMIWNRQGDVKKLEGKSVHRESRYVPCLLIRVLHVLWQPNSPCTPRLVSWR